MTTKAKITIILGVVCISLVMIFGSLIYYFSNKYAYVDFYKRLQARLSISSKYNLEPNDINAESLKNLRNQHLEKLEKEKEYLIEITPLSSIDSIAKRNFLPNDFLQMLRAGQISQGKSGSTLFVGTRMKKAEKEYLVIVSAENYYASHHLIFLRNMIITSIVVIILIVLSLSIYFSRHVFDPIREITDKVKKISTENIHLRLDNNSNVSSRNEIAELTNTFNDLLSRIETAFETQKNFISNASHELGTPLTAIIGEADVSLLKARTTDEYRNSLQNILHQAERLDEISKSLLFLAQTGYKGKSINFEMVRIDEVIWETKRIIDKLNPGNKIYVDLSLLPEDHKKLKVNGNKQLLHLAFSNLLTNACKYSNNGPVSISIASSDKYVILTITDQGVGIPESEIQYIYDPFFRASNVNLFEGYGIGLPLSRNVVQLHKGILTVTSTVNVGTTVQVKLPLMFV